MKVILYMEMSVNGYVATKKDEAPWSDEAWAAYDSKIKEIGNVIVGRRTYDLMCEDNSIMEYVKFPIIVLSSTTPKIAPENHHFVKTPEKALNYLKELGFKTGMVGGGAQTNSAFLKKNLVDELFLDVEPFLFGEGVPLFTPIPLQKNLKLVGTKNLNENTLQLHYTIEGK